MAAKTKHEYVYIEILKKIKNNDLKEGDRLPSEQEMQNLYEVSRHTIRAALTRLENDGIITKEQGVGSFVSSNKQKNETKQIGVITTYLSDYIFPLTIRGIEEELTKAGYSTILASTNNNVSIEEQALKMMIDRNVDGLIIEPTKSSYYNKNIGLYLKIQEMGIPIIMINARYEEIDFPIVAIDDMAAGYKSTLNLIENNHTKIGGIFKEDDRQGKERLKGYIKACQEFGIEYDSENIIMYETENQEEILNTKVFDMIKEKRITGVVCYNDTIALRILEFIWNLGYQVPKDLSIVSHDNSSLSSMTKVKINSINHPKTELGRQAALSIVKMVEDPEYEMKSIIFNPEMDEKTSVLKL